MMLLNKVFLLLSCLECLSLASYYPDYCPSPTPQIDYQNEGGICYTLQSIRGLIPNDTLAAIISQHYLFDSKFRSALDFIKSPEFKVASARLANTNFYTYILLQFKQAGVDTKDIANLQVIFECILIPILGLVGDDTFQPPEPAILIPTEDPGLEYYYYDEDNEDVEYEKAKKRVVVNRRRPVRVVLSPRNFQNMVNEIVDVLPKSEVKSIIQANVGNSTNFGKFYVITRRAYFQTAVLKALKASGLASINRVFKQHYLNLRNLFAAFFKVLNYGPMA